ncbi:DUF1998 domain-containing protein [Mariniluteicoccus endophyticus]
MSDDIIRGDVPNDPLGDADRLDARNARRNYAKVGSSRPSSLMYTYGPGAIMELPHFTIMASGTGEWERVYQRGVGTSWGMHAPKLLDAVRVRLGAQVQEIRRFPVLTDSSPFSDEGRRLGVPAIVFPQWLRCTGCDRLAPLSVFTYRNTNPYRPDKASFAHQNCPGRKGRGASRWAPTVPARYLLACTAGHLDEFPYAEWVHHGTSCTDVPHLKMAESTAGRGASAIIECASCESRRPMNEAQGAAGRAKLPRCRGRHPHLDSFAAAGCDAGLSLLLIGASNLWFPIQESVIVIPMNQGERQQDLADRLKNLMGPQLEGNRDNLDLIRLFGQTAGIDLSSQDDTQLRSVVDRALTPADAAAFEARRPDWSPVELLLPEWDYLQQPVGGYRADAASGLELRTRELGAGLPPEIAQVLAVDSLRSVSALLGFTRIDELDRVLDGDARTVGLTTRPPQWVVGMENRGEGIFLRLDEQAVAAWEARVERSGLWAAHNQAHFENFRNRLSETATQMDADSRFVPPRYWLLHTLSHVLLREMALSSGYGAASISERLYAWQADGDRTPAAGLLLMTTSSDSDGTLGGLVQLSEPDRLEQLVRTALRKATRCSSDPICSHRTPQPPEDFLHGAACHCCSMASETSCEKANRFLDRRFLIPLSGDDENLAFFQAPS